MRNVTWLSRHSRPATLGRYAFHCPFRGRVGTWQGALRAALGAGLLVGVCLTGCATRQPPPAPSPVPSQSRREAQPHDAFVATAYSLHGKTSSGAVTRPGVVAADPRVLPIGLRIRVRGAGRYSGTYTVADTGSAIDGHRIDVYIPSHAEARRFGRRTVHVDVVQRGGRGASSARFHVTRRRSAHTRRRAPNASENRRRT